MIDPDELADKLVTTLPDVLPTLRWFGGKDRPINAVRPLRTTRLSDDMIHVIVAVEQPGRAEEYQLIISEHSEGFDATADPDRNGLLLEKIAAGEHADGIAFGHEQGVELRTSLRGRPIGVEQSNTSLIYGQQY